jgi:uncharacterized membrane protein YphA (DoxX/SURF4 family)
MLVTSATDPRTGLLRTPDQIAKAASIAFARIFLGIMWMFELTVGHNWKIGGFGSDVHPGWIGANRGDIVREDVAEAIADGTYSWFASLYDAVLVPNAVAASWVTIIAQIAIALAFIFGVFVRPAAVGALVMDLSIFMLGNSRIPPFFVALHLFVLATGAGRYYGMDGWLLKKTEGMTSGGAKALRWLIDLRTFDARFRGAAIAGTVLFGLFFFLTIPNIETSRIQNVALMLTAILMLVALGLYASTIVPDKLGVIAGTLRIFVGFMFLHEIWTRVEPGVNGLPGWAGGAAVETFFIELADNHWGLFSSIIETVFIPAAGFWAVVFGVVQFAVGVMLILGFRTRLAAWVGAGFLAALIILGTTRYPPFLLGLLIPVMALDGGRYLSVDRIRLGDAYQARFGLPIPQPLVIPLVILATVNALAAIGTVFATGLEPGAYVESMPAMTTSMVAIFSGLFAAVGFLQLRPGAAIAPDDARELLDASG